MYCWMWTPPTASREIAASRRTGATLRVVTETQPPDAEAVGRLLHTHGVTAPAEIGFVFAERRRPDRREIDVGDDDIFVSTATAESFGQSLLEASACVVPVVAFDVGAVGEVVVDDETGLLVKELKVRLAERH